jgi:hypothetical protein
MTAIEIGRLLRAGTSGFVVGCRVSNITTPSFGSLVRVPLDDGTQIFGLIYDMHIDDDGLVRQLVTADVADEAIIADNRQNRNVPLEMSVLTVGFQQGEHISHLLPPRPPLSLDVIYLCDPAELRDFTGAGRFGYFRHLLRNPDLPVSELIAAHLSQAQVAHAEVGNFSWSHQATKELITLLRDDYPTLISVLGALSDVSPESTREVLGGRHAESY